MAKPGTYPNLYNEVIQLNISNLKSWGYIEPKQTKSGTIKWSFEGNHTASISILVNTKSENPYIELDFKYKGIPRKYKVYLISTQSNINKGDIWYFICPQTKKRCRKLYLIDGYFLHREAFKSSMYESQTKSKKNRQIDKVFEVYFKSDNLYSELYKKNFKKTYAGKPTKKFSKIFNQLQNYNNLKWEK